MARTRRSQPAEGQIAFAPLQAESKTAPGVPAIERAVKGWRADGYRGATETTRDLLISVTNFFRDPDAWAALGSAALGLVALRRRRRSRRRP